MKTACDQYVSAIGELVDGTLGPIRRAELQMHLESCDRCRALVEDLQQIAQTARTLETRQPPEPVWTAIAGRLQAEGRARPRRRGGSRQLVLALAAALVLALGATLVLLMRDGGARPADTGRGMAVGEPDDALFDDPVQSAVSELAAADQDVEHVIEQVGRSDLLADADTATVLQENLLVINQAIAQSQAALEANPDSTLARQSLYDALRQKIQFVQDTLALMNVMRQGDALGAAELVESGKS